MRVLWALALVGLAWGAPESAIRFEAPLTPPPADFPGVVSRAPVTHWSADLPGPKLNAGSHAERARPVVVGEEIWVGSAGGRALWRVSRLNGRLLGSFPAVGAVQSEPVFDTERVWFVDGAGVTFCYDRATGAEIWRHQGPAPILVAPTLADGLIFVANVEDLIVALDAQTGELAWRYQHRRAAQRAHELTLFAAPPPVRAGADLLVGFSDGAVIALDPSRGDVRWERQVGEGRYPDIVAGSTVWGNDIFASGYFSPLVAIDRRSQNIRWRMDAGAANAATLVERTRTPILAHPGTDGVLRGVAALTGALVWTWNSDTNSALTTPVLTPAGLLVGASTGGLYLIDPESGEEIWRYRGDRSLEGVTAAPVVAGRQVLVVTNAGRIHSLLAPQQRGTDDGRWSWRIPEP